MDSSALSGEVSKRGRFCTNIWANKFYSQLYQWCFFRTQPPLPLPNPTDRWITHALSWCALAPHVGSGDSPSDYNSLLSQTGAPHIHNGLRQTQTHVTSQLQCLLAVLYGFDARASLESFCALFGCCENQRVSKRTYVIWNKPIQFEEIHHLLFFLHHLSCVV